MHWEAEYQANVSNEYWKTVHGHDETVKARFINSLFLAQ